MALMSEERRKEMEEEMNRFELEIAGPGDTKASQQAISSRPLSPPPAPPVVGVLIPEALIKAPPPPPPPLSPPIAAALRPPPPPPVIQSQPAAPAPSIRFIPHQVHRQPPRPQMRPPHFVQMHGPPGGFPPPGPFGHPHEQGPMMGPMPPMGAMPSGNQMHPMMQMSPGPPMGPMHGPMGPMPPGCMPMHMPMGMNLPMPPGFCPPARPPMHMVPDGGDQQYFNAMDPSQTEDAEIPVDESASSTSGHSSILAAAPAIYAAPFVKTHLETVSVTLSTTNGQDRQISTIVNSSPSTKPEKVISKSEDFSVGPTIPTSSANEEIIVSKKKEKKKKSVRMAGGQAWEDNSLLEWDPDDFRIFCGDLGNDVTDEVLIRAFSKYSSFVKAKVIRDKRTNKTKGYGFVSFKDPQDFIKAMREMNGRYVGSRPIKLRKSTWRDRNIDLVKKKQKEKEKLGLL